MDPKKLILIEKDNSLVKELKLRYFGNKVNVISSDIQIQSRKLTNKNYIILVIYHIIYLLK